MFTKLAYLKCISLMMLAGKIFKDYEMFSWFEIIGVVVIPAFVFILLDGLSNKLDNLLEKIDLNGSKI